jgi:hypothetical protein
MTLPPHGRTSWAFGCLIGQGRDLFREFKKILWPGSSRIRCLADRGGRGVQRGWYCVTGYLRRRRQLARLEARLVFLQGRTPNRAIKSFNDPNVARLSKRPPHASSCATPTGRRWPSSIARMSPEGGRRASCSHGTKPVGSPPTLPKCRTYCSDQTDSLPKLFHGTV